MIEIQFKPWRPFIARKNPLVIRKWLRRVGEASVRAFKGGMRNYPPASAPGAWPNIRTGALRRSIKFVTTNDTLIVGSNVHYSKYLRKGTRKMDRRKMSDDALKEGLAKTKSRLGKWVEWSR